MSDSLAPRGVAFDLVAEVLRRRVPFEDACERHPRFKEQEPRDRAFVRLLAATLFRRLGQVDQALSRCYNRPQPPKAPVQDLLRLGAVQLLFLGTPAHAAVDTTVALAEQRGFHPYKGLINALLRRLAREGAACLAGQDAGRLNTPDWLWLAWRQAYGINATRNLVKAHLEEAPLDFSVRGDPQAWAERLEGLVLPTGTVRRPAGGNVTDLPGFAEGGWWVQDAAAALPARLLGDVRGQQVIDLCAAPGGKTAQLAAAGARVVAVDRSDARLRRLKDNLSRLGLSAEVVVADATVWTPTRPADAVLVDAPCSATGTIRRHPDILHLKTAADVTALAHVQRRLLEQAVRMVRPGGMVVYCTCSLQPEEGEAPIARLVERNPAIQRVPIRAEELSGPPEWIQPTGAVRTLPGALLPDPWGGSGGVDGFYIARLRVEG